MLPLDSNVLRRLATDIGEEGLQQALALFHEELSQMAAELVPVALDSARLAKQAHVIKSSSATFGATLLRELAADIESRAQSGEPVPVVDLQRLQAVLVDTMAAVSAELDAGGR